MKRLMFGILSLLFLITISSCGTQSDPEYRVQNQRTSKANVQIQTSGGNTVNINDVEAGQLSEFQSTAEGDIIVTAVIQNEAVSPTTTFAARKDKRYTIVILTGNIPSLRVDQE
jgi:ABC-type Fe3+-hydroxamate transport system substrate-binding protein